MRIVVSTLAYAKILHHSLTRRTEIIGLLVGKKANGILRIEDIWTGSQKGTHVSATLDHAVQSKLAERLHEDGELYIVGWYHSHPNIGVFMSPTDVETQKAYQALFGDAVALVIDPARFAPTNDPFSVGVKIFQIVDGYAKEVKWEFSKMQASGGSVREIMTSLDGDRQWLRQIRAPEAGVRADVPGYVLLYMGIGILISVLILALLFLSGLLVPTGIESGISIDDSSGDTLVSLGFAVAMLLIIASVGKFLVKAGTMRFSSDGKTKHIRLETSS